jgi:hypothetical protein
MTVKRSKKQYGVAPGCVPVPRVKVHKFKTSSKPRFCPVCQGSRKLGVELVGIFDCTTPCFACLSWD